MHSVRSRGGQHTSLSARRDAGFIDPNRLARRRTKPGDAGPSCEGVPTGGIASPGALVADSVRIISRQRSFRTISPCTPGELVRLHE